MINPSPLERLRECAVRIESGPWELIRLRGLLPLSQMIDKDDVDVLCSRDAIYDLLASVFEWVKSGDCHMRVISNSEDKVALYLISIDGLSVLHFDLWINIWQIDRRTKRLTFESCAHICERNGMSILRFPILVEAAIFVQHLIGKRKDCSNPKQLERMEYYQNECCASDPVFAKHLQIAREQKHVHEDLEMHASKIVHENIVFVHSSSYVRFLHRIKTSVIRCWHHSPKKLSMIAIMGCDGSGKTTLSRQIMAKDSQITQLYTGKHLYRKWMIYKLLVIFLRPLLFQKREKFDETLAPIIYLLACWKLLLKSIFSPQGITVIDRSIVDFLMLARKSDEPRFSRFLWLTHFFGIRIPHIQIVTNFVQLRERKLEMTEKGHTIYDQLMFRHFTRRYPTDYTVFSNLRTLEDATVVLPRIVTLLKKR